MDNLEIQRQAINLGNKLVEELGREPNMDTLSRWMAHYVAEQIVIAEKTAGVEGASAGERCFRTILALWEHRSSLPPGCRPFESFEPILRALERLDPESPRAYYHRISDPRDAEPESGSISDLIGFIFAIDAATRVLIEAVLLEAVEKATNEKTLAYLNEAIPTPSMGDVGTIRQLIKRLDGVHSDGDDDKEAMKKEIQARIEKLDSFCASSKIVREGFVRQLKEIDDI